MVQVYQVTLELFGALLARPDDWRFGYEVARETRIRHGTLYPLLIRLEKDGLLESHWDLTEGKRRHMYRLTARGRDEARLILEARGWKDHFSSQESSGVS